MAEIVELDEQQSEIEAVEQQAQSKPQEQAPNPDSDLPEKYRGKSVKDIVRMHEEAEKKASRMANEVGEVRKLADELLKANLQPKPKAEQKDEVDFFANPQEAISQAVAAHPDVRAARESTQRIQMEQNQRKMVEKHPDMSQIVADPEFIDWVKASPIRRQLFQAADAYNVEAGDELLSTFKELRKRKTEVETKVEDDTRRQTMRAAAVDAGGSGESGKKVYRRADLIRMKIHSPEKYAAMSDEIYAAYATGRVK